VPVDVYVSALVDSRMCSDVAVKLSFFRHVENLLSHNSVLKIQKIEVEANVLLPSST
jgi:hypothetical protein